MKCSNGEIQRCTDPTTPRRQEVIFQYNSWLTDYLLQGQIRSREEIIECMCDYDYYLGRKKAADDSVSQTTYHQTTAKNCLSLVSKYSFA